MGGSQINAIELAASIRGLGHDVVIYAPDGELSQKIADLGLSWVQSPSGTKLSIAWIRGLRRLARAYDPDIVHTYEWATSIGAAYAFRSIGRATQVMTVLSMDVPRFLPTHLHLTVGTRQLAETLGGRGRVAVIEPPIDTESNRASDVDAARRRIRASGGDFVISMVCRMTNELDKANGVIDAIKVAGDLAKDFQVRLMVAGDGGELARITRHADAVNQRLGHDVVEVLGSVLDPGDIYEGSDVVLGMGSSVLRGMAYGKPVVVQGANGYWELLTPSTLETFLRVGFYGNGGSGAAALQPFLVNLMENPEKRDRLGTWSREVVVSRFGLTAAAGSLETVYRVAKAETYRKPIMVLSLCRSMVGLTKFRISTGIKQRSVA
ncbi:glycosyltransferase family 4 protein [Paeniglutamicibacter gangotriensis]|uniref:Glycosyltransferase family 4 protein n=1 Tax=Paeniglutamicibacter gangotriensis TaxID=254787 RepID=A0A5B0EES6_9MICC|nr:glycosyltransferase family 4 protein [Paeniglutamicibacter gangotriensis]KAA0977547.1 glycosyltransferase family 4 protein [Paeniglutamicibacter gangotriensis]